MFDYTVNFVVKKVDRLKKLKIVSIPVKIKPISQATLWFKSYIVPMPGIIRSSNMKNRKNWSLY